MLSITVWNFNSIRVFIEISSYDKRTIGIMLSNLIAINSWMMFLEYLKNSSLSLRQSLSLKSIFGNDWAKSRDSLKLTVIFKHQGVFNQL